jgi:aldehyde dehydrogenase (NAD+)
MGKPLSSAAGDIEEARNITNYFSGLLELADGQTALNTSEYLNMSIRQPFGLVAGIVPWNFPSMIVGCSF